MFGPFRRLFQPRSFVTAVSSSKALRSKLISEVKDNSTVAEFGCGDGFFAGELLSNKHDISYHGFDSQGFFLKQARKRLSGMPMVGWNHNSFEFRYFDLAELRDFKPEVKYDFLLFFEVFCYFTRGHFERSTGTEPIDRVIPFLKPLLGRKGVLLIIEPDSEYAKIPSRGHRAIDRRKLAKCLELNGFDVKFNRRLPNYVNDRSASVYNRFIIKAVPK